MTISEVAPAKINLYLHVGPVRAAGLHDLASLFVFTAHGDRVIVSDADDFSLHLSGPFAKELSGFPLNENLVLRAAEALRDAVGGQRGARITLEKNLPLAAGIGGGSSDAAAALRALLRLWNVSIDPRVLHKIAFSLGADVPACLESKPVLVEGAGEILKPAPRLATMAVLLVNPRVQMPTGPVFAAFDRNASQTRMPTHPASFPEYAQEVPAFMKATRNDLEAAALSIDNGAIATTLDLLAMQDGVRGTRMSGSGATCFALFDDDQSAAAARKSFPDERYWSLVSTLASD